MWMYYISKTSKTSADTLLAVGVASYLAQIHLKLYKSHTNCFIRDMGSCYALDFPLPLEHLERVSLSEITVVPAFNSHRQREKLAKKGLEGEMIASFDYDQAMEESKRDRERLKELPRYLQAPDAKLKHGDELASHGIHGPHTHLNHYQTINMMKIAGSFNELVQRWVSLTEDQMHLHLHLLLDLCAHPDNDIDAAITTWQKLAKEQHLTGKALVSALQIINPTTGKGANRAKARELTIGNQESFWLLELFKFRGFLAAAAPFVIRDSKDRKIYVLEPKEIELHLLEQIMQTFRAVLWPSSAVKLDVLASLRLAQVLVHQYKKLYQTNTVIKKWGRRKITSIVQGFEVTSYKDLGSAYATMNISTLHLPTWTWLPKLESSTQVRDAEALLDEHLTIIQHIRNSKGEEGAEEYELLRFYRDFLSGNDLRPFWNFTTAYSGYLMSAFAANRYMPQLTTQGLEKLLVQQQVNEIPLTEILTNPGFKQIAYAIRQATVTAQYRWTQKNDRTYEIRYGLGQKLMRNVHHRTDFLYELSVFLLSYNEETAREEEKAVRAIANKTGKPLHPLTKEERSAYNLRFSVSTEHIDEIAKLIDRFRSPELIGSMLIAYGYARDVSQASRNERSTKEDGQSDTHNDQ